jgi:hypothetical protein
MDERGRPAEQRALDLDPRHDPGPGTRTNTIGHPVERMLSASARDILDALENGFRARADLKGKLAELFMSRHLDELQRAEVIDHYEWFDQDGIPDFTIRFTDGTEIRLEVKNVRSGNGPLRAETQKTRASRGDPMSRYYRVDQFEIIAECLFNAIGRWDYVFARSTNLLRLATDPAYLATIQPIDRAITPPWYRTLAEVL